MVWYLSERSNSDVDGDGEVAALFLHSRERERLLLWKAGSSNVCGFALARGCPRRYR